MILDMSRRLLMLAVVLQVLAIALFAFAAVQGNWLATGATALTLGALTFTAVDLRRRGRAQRTTGIGKP